MDSDGEGRAGSRSAVTGTVMEQLPSALYRVKLEGGALVTAHIADRMDRNFVRVLVGDRVRLELSPVDRGRGRIVEKLP
ncbi:MAG: translation initiation factor IF-1 [Acidobacteria bacterium]|nr:translation initiation factor IF-1 [Acidobacteriota bacterium]